MLADLYNTTLREGYLPSSMESFSVCPLPNQCPPQIIESDFRPISLSSQTTKVLEGLTPSRVPPVSHTSLMQNSSQSRASPLSTRKHIALHIALEALAACLRQPLWLFQENGPLIFTFNIFIIIISYFEQE